MQDEHHGPSTMRLTTPALLQALAATPVLVGLNRPALVLLSEEGIVRDFVLSDLIVKEGEAGNSFFILVEGDVEVIKRYGTPYAVILATLHARNFFGEMSVVDPVARAASVRALSNVRTIEIKAGTLYHLFRQMPDQYSIVLLNIARDLARRLRHLDEAFAARAS
jgi:CRP/FNR family transcriptional regulator, cyclic AMP receptor protein